MSNPVTRFFASRGFARGLGALGRFMITSGVVILLLVAYQIWGTNLETNKDQKALTKQFHSAVAHHKAAVADDPPSTTAATIPGDDGTVPAKVAASNIAPPGLGDVIGQISIPSIGLTDFNIIEGTTVPELKRGAGHYVGHPLPGQAGNSAIAGHRTTYGAPFHNIDKVKIGDPIIISTLQGTFRYLVTGQSIVKPTDVSVLLPTPDPTLTLTACHPKFSASKRIITFAKLVGNPVPALRNQQKVAAQVLKQSKATESADTIDDLSSGPIVRYPGAWWGLACMLMWLVVRLLAWFGHRERKSPPEKAGTRFFPRAIPYVLGTPICLLFLYLFFEAFSYEAFTHALHLNF